MTGAAARRCARSLWLIASWCVLVAPRAALANGADLPAEIPLQGFVKPENDHLHVLVRVPLVLLTSFALPKRGPGYLDLANLDPALQRAATASARQIELRENGTPVAPDQVKGRISLLSDHSFQSYQAAFDHLQSPPLPADTDLFWNQGFFDVQLDYPIGSDRSHFSIDTNIAPELGQRLKLHLEFLPIDRPPLHYRLPGRSGRIALDPRWYEAAWLFAKLGLFDGFAFDRLVFLVCLVAPFRHFRSLLAVVLALSAMQALSSNTVALSSSADSPFLAALSGTTLAAAIVLLAIGNLATPSLRRRWFAAAIVGAASGFELGEQLADALQFAGSSTIASMTAFDIGGALAQIVTLALVLAGLRLLLTRKVGAAFCLVVLSAILGHMAWHWMVDQGHELAHQFSHGGLSTSFNTAAPCVLAALLLGAVAFLLPRGFGAPPIASLRAALFDRGDPHHP